MSATTDVAEAPVESRVHYLNARLRHQVVAADHGPQAHRAAVLVSITFMFFVGGSGGRADAAGSDRAAGALVQPETYNKLFTMHGIIMIFFFLIPSIPAVLGNFLVPMMIGARDLAFPRLNLLSWYIYIIGAVLDAVRDLTGGVDTGWTFYTPYSSTYSNTPRDRYGASACSSPAFPRS